jgi:hypothetical protein
MLDGGRGDDIYEAGPGNDLIIAADGTVERIGCGPGVDTVLADAGDRLFNCERISRLQPESR